MIDFAEELRRLTADSEQVGPPPAGGLIAEIDVRCSGDAPTVLARVKDLLGVVVQHRLMHPPDEEAEPDPGPFEVDVGHWTATLPQWFLDRTPFDSANRTSGVWTVEA